MAKSGFVEIFGQASYAFYQAVKNRHRKSGSDQGSDQKGQESALTPEHTECNNGEATDA